MKQNKLNWIKYIAPLSALASLGLLAGCSVEKVDEGRAPSVDVDAEAGEMPKIHVEEGEMPDVDVAVDAGELPEYDVDSRVGVEMEERTIRVPEITWDEEENQGLAQEDEAEREVENLNEDDFDSQRSIVRDQ